MLDVRVLLPALLSLVLVALACAPAPGPPPPTPLAPPPTAPTPSPEGRVSASPGPSGPEQALVSRARADVAARAGVGIDQVQAVQVEEREWRDASLGCPAPGMLYAQVITPGYLVVLEAGGRRFEYHTDRASKLVLCEGGRPA
ncbi:MAG: hypothetical protein HY690_16075 [Chloroflexi bacterium]|nr:hypothetical protein [Chloroflexota bacterium]